MSRSLHAKFQVEIQRHGQVVRMDVTSYQVTDRRGTRLEAETQVQDPFHNRVVFHVRNAENFEQVQEKAPGPTDPPGICPFGECDSSQRMPAQVPRDGSTGRSSKVALKPSRK